MPETSLETYLQEIDERLSDVDRPPATTLAILGEAKRERYWEDLLVYFLDPDNPHGFGSDVLAAFLHALSEHEDSSLPALGDELKQVEVQSQVPIGDGPFDILLWKEDTWYVVIELKVGTAETGAQTRRYAEASQLGDLVVSQHEGASEYIYLAPENAVSSAAEDFIDVSWEHIVPFFEDILRTSHGQYPSKSHAQFADYLDTIKRTLNMDEFTAISEETKLYTEYADTIDRLREAYEDDKAKIFEGIQTAFFDELDGPRDVWTVNNRPSGYINFAKNGWGSVADGVRIEYEPHVKLNRDNPKIRLRLDIENSNKEQIREELNNELDQADRDALEAADWEVVDGSYAFLAKSIPLNLDRPVDSIHRAIQELHDLREIVETHIDDIVARYQNSSE